MAARLVFVLLLVTTPTAVAAGCSGGDSPELSAESQAAVDRIQSICDDAAAKVDASRGEFPVADFDPKNPNPADLPAVGSYFAVGHTIWDEALREDPRRPGAGRDPGRGGHAALGGRAQSRQRKGTGQGGAGVRRRRLHRHTAGLDRRAMLSKRRPTPWDSTATTRRPRPESTSLLTSGGAITPLN